MTWAAITGFARSRLMSIGALALCGVIIWLLWGALGDARQARKAAEDRAARLTTALARTIEERDRTLAAITAERAAADAAAREFSTIRKEVSHAEPDACPVPDAIVTALDGLRRRRGGGDAPEGAGPPVDLSGRAGAAD